MRWPPLPTMVLAKCDYCDCGRWYSEIAMHHCEKCHGTGVAYKPVLPNPVHQEPEDDVILLTLAE